MSMSITLFTIHQTGGQLRSVLIGAEVPDGMMSECFVAIFRPTWQADASTIMIRWSRVDWLKISLDNLHYLEHH